MATLYREDLKFHKAPKVEREPSLHDILCTKAKEWLKRQGCKVAFHDKFKAVTGTGEQPDAIGWRSGASILIECKASRSDFLSDKGKRFRKDPGMGMGDWRFYFCPPGVVTLDDLPDGWGLLYCRENKVERVFGLPRNNADWFDGKPFDGNKHAENSMLVSALRRLQLHGHLDLIYQPLDEIDKDTKFIGD